MCFGVYNKHKHTEIVPVNDNGFWLESDFVKKETDNPNIAFTSIDYKNREIQQCIVFLNPAVSVWNPRLI